MLAQPKVRASAPSFDPVTEVCRAVRRQLGSDFTGIRSKRWHTATFSGAVIELDLSHDVPGGLDAYEFRPRGMLVANIAAVGPRTLSILAVEA